MNSFIGVRTVVVSLFVCSQFALAECSEVEFDCPSHTVKIDGNEAGKISCGDHNVYGTCKGNGITYSGTGKIGGPHNGQVVTGGLEIEGIPRMGQDGGGKVIHNSNPHPPPYTEVPDGDTTCGCVVVDGLVLQKLTNECQQKKLVIKGNEGGASGVSVGNGGRGSGRIDPRGNYVPTTR